MVVVEKGGINKNFKESLTELLKIKQINFVFDVGRILKRFSLFFYELNFILIYFFKENLIIILFKKCLTFELYYFYITIVLLNSY